MLFKYSGNVWLYLLCNKINRHLPCSTKMEYLEIGADDIGRYNIYLTVFCLLFDKGY